MKNILEDIKLWFESIIFTIHFIPIFIEDFKKEKKRRKYGDLNLQQKMSEEHYHKMNTWTHWRGQK